MTAANAVPAKDGEENIPQTCSLQEPGSASKGKPSALTYRIPSLDSLHEERIVRGNLAGEPGIVDLTVHLSERLLTVRHTLPCSCSITEILKGCGREPASARDGDFTLYELADMKTETDAERVRTALASLEGVLEVAADCRRACVGVYHADGARPSIGTALDALHLGSRQKSPAPQSDAPSAPQSLPPLSQAISQAISQESSPLAMLQAALAAATPRGPEPVTLTYAVPALDGPEEETSIRTRLERMEGIQGLTFHTACHLLSISCVLEDPSPIASVLAELGLPCEGAPRQGEFTLYEAQRLTDENETLVHTILEGVSGVTEVATDVAAHTIGVFHGRGLRAATAMSLAPLGLGAVQRSPAPRLRRRYASLRIPAMDCSHEETLIRNALEKMDGIDEMVFHLKARVLTLRHALPDLNDVVLALTALGMPPEERIFPGEFTFYDVPALDCPVEERLIKKALSSVFGVADYLFDRVGHTMGIFHAEGIRPVINCALEELTFSVTQETPPPLFAKAQPKKEGYVCSCCEDGDACDAAPEASVAPETGTGHAAFGSHAVRYHVEAMDCPVEEGLIRRKLEGMEGIRSLSFNLTAREFTVVHDLADPSPIEKALIALEMPPERLDCADIAESTFLVADMDCPVEEGLVRSCLEKMPGVRSMTFDLERRTVTVRHDEGELPSISQALADLELGSQLADTGAGRKPAVPVQRFPWKRLVPAGILAFLAELCEIVEHVPAVEGFIDALHPGALPIAGLHLGVLDVASLVLSLAAIALCGLATFRKGWGSVRSMNLNMNALMSVATTGGVLIGEYPEAAMVMVLFNISEAIEAKCMDHARNSIKGLVAMAPDTVTVLGKDGKWQERDVREVAVGTLARVRPGEKIALDGIVTDGMSSIDQSPITGESIPVEKRQGDAVYAGTINGLGSFDFTVTAAATHTKLSRIVHAVEEAQASRAPIQRFIDVFARWYTPCIFLAAVLTAVLMPHVAHVDWKEAVYMGLVILVIGCPCALVISTPVTLFGGLASATRKGLIVKGGMYLELGRKLSVIAMDKTGTVTVGKPRLVGIERIMGIDEQNILRIAASLAARSDHPVSLPIAEKATEQGMPLIAAEDFTALPGKGVRGNLDGIVWHMGSPSLLRDLGFATPELEGRIVELQKQGETVVALVSPKGCAALFRVMDTARDTAARAIRELNELGVRTVMLTGDNAHAARAVAFTVGCGEVRANLLPEHKLDVIDGLRKDGAIVGMVGDGINDAPALARADVGFAMTVGGTDTAIETADVALMTDDLRTLPRFIRLCRSTYAILIQNIALALGIKATCFALTLAGFATMWMAVFADVGTTLVVVANGLRAIRK